MILVALIMQVCLVKDVICTTRQIDYKTRDECVANADDQVKLLQAQVAELMAEFIMLNPDKKKEYEGAEINGHWTCVQEGDPRSEY